MANELTPQDIFSQYGVLNDFRPADGLSGDRRSLTTTDAISAVLEQAFTPDAMANKTVFGGIVFGTYLGDQPVISNPMENLQYVSSQLERANNPELTGEAIYYKYKVYVHEDDPRVLIDIDELLRGSAGKLNLKGMSLSARVDTLPEATLALEAEIPGTLRAILPGTLVSIIYTDEKFQRPQIIKVGPKIFDINFQDSSIKIDFKNKRPMIMGPRGTVSKDDPGIFSWSNKAKQKSATYIPTDTVIYNGELENSDLLFTDPNSGAKLIKDAKDDWLKLTAAYKEKFGKQLKGSGYRTYDSQVSVRMIRVGGDEAGCPGPYGNGVKGEGAGQYNKNCKFVGYAATPGTSNHGWGSAVDIDRPASGWTGDQAGNSPEFKWLNKFAPEKFNFNFGVSGEHWHLDWTGFNKVVSGVSVSTKRWSQEGVEDEGVTFAAAKTPDVATF